MHIYKTQREPSFTKRYNHTGKMVLDSVVIGSKKINSETIKQKTSMLKDQSIKNLPPNEFIENYIITRTQLLGYITQFRNIAFNAERFKNSNQLDHNIENLYSAKKTEAQKIQDTVMSETLNLAGKFESELDEKLLEKFYSKLEHNLEKANQSYLTKLKKFIFGKIKKSETEKNIYKITIEQQISIKTLEQNMTELAGQKVKIKFKKRDNP